MMIGIQVVSLIGAVLILVAYVAAQRGIWTPDRTVYLWANFVGSTLLAVVAIIDRRLGFILLEVIWAAVSLWGIIRPRRAQTPDQVPPPVSP
jgi:hypothetical protein